jgi:hypothetical protein
MSTRHKAIVALALCACAGQALPPQPPSARPLAGSISPPTTAPERVSPFAALRGPAPVLPAAARHAPVSPPSAPAAEEDQCTDEDRRPRAAATIDAIVEASAAQGRAGTHAAHAAALLVAGRVDQLAATAASSRDPVAYAIAWQACLQADARDAPSCSLLNAAQWARLEPDNAVVWLTLAEEASEHGDSQLEAEAMARAAGAPTARSHSAAVPALLGPAAPRRQPLSLDTLTAGWRASSMWRAVGPGQVQRYCEPAAPGSERAAVCDRLAAMLIERASDLPLRSAGIELARRLGWSAGRVEAWSEEQAALEEIGGPQTMISMLDCANALRVQRWMGAVEAQGEVQRLRQLLHESGLSAHDWGQRRRRDLALAESTVQALARHGD